jgi:hypothetical protein
MDKDKFVFGMPLGYHTWMFSDQANHKSVLSLSLSLNNNKSTIHNNTHPYFMDHSTSCLSYWLSHVSETEDVEHTHQDSDTAQPY